MDLRASVQILRKEWLIDSMQNKEQRSTRVVRARVMEVYIILRLLGDQRMHNSITFKLLILLNVIIEPL